jgi:hypothetical protein
MPERHQDHSPPVPVVLSDGDREKMGQQVEAVTHHVVLAVREVIKVAQDLEALVVENAARVRVELDEHVLLAGAVKKEAAQLSGIIAKMRNAQEQIAVQRRNGNGKE